MTVTVTDKDDDSGSAEAIEFKVVYDPNDGFATGGEWIQSLSGNYLPDPSAEGKASFGFVSKYKNGQSVPSGNTEFQFKTGNLNFHSDIYDWLVIAGACANYKGAGTINGTGNFGFMLTATDAELANNTSDDLFRIKIWDKDENDAVVYDNKMGLSDDGYEGTAIGGGNIKIHKGSLKKEDSTDGEDVLVSEVMPEHYGLS